jgi:MFS family permease
MLFANLNKNELYNHSFLISFFINFFMGFLFSLDALFPLYVQHEGGGVADIGFFMAAFFLAGMLSRPITGVFVDRFGVKPVLFLGALCLSLPAYGFMLSLGEGMKVWVWGLRIIQGFGWGCHMTAFFTMAAQAAPRHRRNETISMYGISGMAASMIGPVSGEMLIKQGGLPAFFWLYAGIGFAALAMIYLVTVPPRPTKDVRLDGLLALLRLPRIWFVFALAMLHSVSISSISAFLSPVAMERGIEMFGLFFTAFSISGICVRLIGGKWGDRYGLLIVLLPGQLCGALGLLCVNWSYHLPVLVLAGIFSGIAHGLSFPVITTLGYTLSPKAFRGTGVALVTGMMDAGIAMAAVVLGLVGRRYGMDHLFALSAVGPGIAVVLMAVWGNRAIPGTKR